MGNLTEGNRPLLGAVDTGGVIRFSGEINECRDFLRRLGLDDSTRRGWEGNGYSGMLEFWQGQYHAAAWRAE